MTDKGLRELAGLTRLTRLDLQYCAKVTDAGVRQLAGLRGLQRLELDYCAQVSERAGGRNRQELNWTTNSL